MKRYKPKSATPNFSQSEVIAALQELYGVAARVTPLHGDIDQNFLVYQREEPKYVLKIANRSRGHAELEAESRALAYLQENARDVHAPGVCSSIDDQEIETVTDRDGISFFCRLQTYVPGDLFAAVTVPASGLFNSLGRFFGKLDRALSGFSHPATLRKIPWDLKHTADLAVETKSIVEPGNRRVVDHFLMQFETAVQKNLNGLRKQVIHNDGNDHNILVESGRVSGIIDFGDMVYSHTICDLAVVVAYAMLGKADPLETACHIITGYHKSHPVEPEEISLLFYLICARLCISAVISSSRQHSEPENQYNLIHQEPIWHLLKRLIKVNPIHAQDRFRKACKMEKDKSDLGLSSSQIAVLREKHIGKSLSVSYDRPLKIVQGAMQYLFSHDGSTYLDCVNNVCHVGHCHPTVVRAIQNQTAILNTNTRYLHENLVAYARRLAALLPDPLNVCFLANSGSEANDLALRLARAYTARKDVLVVDGAYHGNLGALIEISPYKHDGPGGNGPPSHVHKVQMPDGYRGSFKRSDGRAGEKYARDVLQAIDNAHRDGRRIAAFICESLLSCGGQIVLPQGYLAHAYAYVRKAGGVCIADEVQVGFGRTGSHFWGFQTQGVVPDIVTMGKPIGNGYPLAAVVTTAEIADSFANGMEYFNTFGGNPVACAAGLAVLDVLEIEGLQEHAMHVGAGLQDNLTRLQSKHMVIGDVRGLGLFLGVELVEDRELLTPAEGLAREVVEQMKEKGILLSTDGPCHNVLKIKPPLVFTQEDAARVVASLDQVLTDQRG